MVYYYAFTIQLLCWQWDLVCDKGYGSETTQMALVLGVFVGAMGMSPISDKFGRKRTFLLSACAGSFFLFVTAWATDFYLFIVLRFLVGIFLQVCPIISCVHGFKV